MALRHLCEGYGARVVYRYQGGIYARSSSWIAEISFCSAKLAFQTESTGICLEVQGKKVDMASIM